MTREHNSPDQRLVTVCSECLRACCWQGEFYCDNYRSASTVEKTIAELRELGLEHPDYWKGASVRAPKDTLRFYDDMVAGTAPPR